MHRHKHITFNPYQESLQNVIDRLGENTIWSLSHIVPFTEFESVAVFEAWDGEAEERMELIKPKTPADFVRTDIFK